MRNSVLYIPACQSTHDSVVGMVASLWAGNQGIMVQLIAIPKDFSLVPTVRKSCEAHTAFYSTCIRGYFARGKVTRE
jgi:hypothetical protein